MPIYPARFWAGSAVALLAALVSHSSFAQERTVTIFAAASLQTALDEIVLAWRQEAGGSAVISYAASSALARQIEQGAPADIFISADLDWMAYLVERRLIDAASRTALLGNRMVLVAPAANAEPVTITPALDLAVMLDGGRLAVADTDAVPAGRYARAALESLGFWQNVAAHLAPTENVRAALALVSRGEAPLGIVYATDAAADPAVVSIGIFPAESHPPIVYPAAMVTGRVDPSSAAFFTYLRSPTAVCIFLAQGFIVLAPEPEPATCAAGG